MEKAPVKSEMEQWVEWYEGQGLTYFPLYGILNGACRCKDGAACGDNTGKHPIFKWKGKPSRIPRDTDNIAINTDPLIVLDFDTPDMAQAEEFPHTFTTATHQGFHLWYWADPSKDVKTMAGWRHKVDIRAKGGLVVAPPSRHRKGGVYRHVRGDKIEPIPANLLKDLPEKGSASGHRRIGYEVDVTLAETHPVMQPLGRMLVREMSEATENRNQTLFRLGCRYFEQAATGLLGADVLTELFEAAVVTGLTPEEVERTLDSARKSV
jgi:hypothetical protein